DIDRDLTGRRTWLAEKVGISFRTLTRREEQGREALAKDLAQELLKGTKSREELEHLKTLVCPSLPVSDDDVTKTIRRQQRLISSLCTDLVRITVQINELAVTNLQLASLICLGSPT